VPPRSRQATVDRGSSAIPVPARDALPAARDVVGDGAGDGGGDAGGPPGAHGGDGRHGEATREGETSEPGEDPPGRARRPHPLERAPEREPVLEAPLRLARDRSQDRELDPDGDLGAPPADRLDGAGLDPTEDLEHALALERGLPRQALVEDRAEREDVRRRPDALEVRDLLGGHVGGGAADRPALRDREALARALGLRVEVLREPEVRDERPAVGLEEHVLGLHVPVDDPPGVGDAERGRQAPAERDRLLDPERPAVEPVAQRAALDERHDDVSALARLAGVEERHEALGGAERREEPALPLEPGDRLLGVGAAEEHLHRDGRALRRARAQDDAHAAATDLALDLVRPDPHGPESVPPARRPPPRRRIEYRGPAPGPREDGGPMLAPKKTCFALPVLAALLGACSSTALRIGDPEAMTDRDEAAPASVPEPAVTAIDSARRLATSADLRSLAPALLVRPSGPALEPLPLEAMRVSTVLTATRARTLVDCTFANPHLGRLEGTLLVRLPDGASPCYLGMFQGDANARGSAALLLPPPLESPALLLGSLDGGETLRLASRWSREGVAVDWGTLRPARVVEEKRGAVVYEATTRRRVDPALMEWSGDDTLRTRIFPIEGGGKKRVFFAYDEPAKDVAGRTLVALPVPAKLPAAFRLEVAADARVFESASVVSGRGDAPLAPREGFLEATLAPTGDAQEGSFVLAATARSRTVRAGFGSTQDLPGALVHARLSPTVAPRAGEKTGSAVFLLDTSLSQRTKLGASSGKLLRAILERDASIERFQVIAFDVTARPLFPGWRDNTPEERERTLEAVESVWLEGATNLDAALTSAEGALADGARPTFFLLSDAEITWGVEEPRELERAHPALFRERWIGYEIGVEPVNHRVLERLTRSGGRIVPVTGAQDLAAAALAHRSLPTRLTGVRVEGVASQDLVVAGAPATLFPGQVLEVAFRTGEDPRAARVVVTSEADGETGSEAFPLEGAVARDPVAMRAWAELTASALLDLRVREADATVLALSQRFALVNRVASFLILETDAEYAQNQLGKARLDLEHLTAEAAAQTARRPIGAPDTSALGDGALAFVSEIARVTTKPWPRHARRLVGPGSFSRPRWPEHLDPTEVHREAERRADAGRDEEALRILSSLVEEKPRDAAALRLVAFTLMGWERFAEAAELFARIRTLRPFEPQAYLGEALALEALGKGGEAALRYEIVLAGHFDPRYERYAKATAERLQARLLAKLGRRDRAPALALDLPAHEVHLLWNLDDTDVDLHVAEASGEEVYYGHARSATGGALLWDNTAGLGPEIYTHPTAAPAEVFVHYFGTRSVAGVVPSATLVVIWNRDANRGEDVLCRSAVLSDRKEKAVLYGSGAN
jgi:hypothetical protein